MKWDEQLNKAIDYIERNLDGEIDMDKVAQIMCQSKTSFQRSFSLIMNISINEYIRKRRMTLAAIMLRNTDAKVIDLALQFGYESPESFARSFKEIHGVTPSAARKRTVQLNLFPRISCLLTIKGEIQMGTDYRIESVNGQKINWEGVDWEVVYPTIKVDVTDNAMNTSARWKEAGHTQLLEIGARMGHNAIYFAKQGFNVSAIDISDYAIQYCKDWAKREGLTINAEVGDMHSIPFADNSFDCLFAYHAVSHTNLPGVKKTIAEIERVLKPNGDVYLSFSSKDSTQFIEKRWQAMDENTLISPHPAEPGVPHFFADLSDIGMLLFNFDIENIKHTGYFAASDDLKQKFYYVSARMK